MNINQMSQNQKLLKHLEGIYSLATERLPYMEEDAEVDDSLLVSLGKIAELAHTAMRDYQTGKSMKTA